MKGTAVGSTLARWAIDISTGAAKSLGAHEVAKVHAPDTTRASVSRRVLQKPNPPPSLDTEAKERLFQEFLEWQNRQGNMP